MRRVYVDGGKVVQLFLRDGLDDHHRSRADKKGAPRPRSSTETLDGFSEGVERNSRIICVDRLNPQPKAAIKEDS